MIAIALAPFTSFFYIYMLVWSLIDKKLFDPDAATGYFTKQLAFFTSNTIVMGTVFTADQCYLNSMTTCLVVGLAWSILTNPMFGPLAGIYIDVIAAAFTSIWFAFLQYLGHR